MPIRHQMCIRGNREDQLSENPETWRAKRSHPIDFSTAYSNRIVVDAQGLKIPLVSIEDLKKLKELAGRPQDIADIKALIDLIDIKNNEN